MRTILSTNGGEILVDDWNYDRLSKYKWYITRSGLGYAQKTVHDEPRLMHHVVLNADPWILKRKELEADHIDRNKVNNQESNLRVITIPQNRINRFNISPKYRGTSCVYGKWQASITISNKKIYIGRYDTREEAALAYNLKAIELLGEFAILNEVAS